MDVYTCISCRVTFKDADLQRTHYKTDWHRYNLKRKVAELTPITFAEFEQKLVTQRQKLSKEAEGQHLFCQCCNKGFSSLNAYNNHLKSKKHKVQLEKNSQLPNTAKDNEPQSSLPLSAKPSQKSSRSENIAAAKVFKSLEEAESYTDSEDDDWEDEEVEEVVGDGEELSDEEDESLPPNFCLFCPHRSVDVEENLRHMIRSHSFYIPDIDYLTDVTGLLAYLGAKVGHGKVCLYCNEKSRNFSTLESVRMHMQAKGHGKIAYEGDAALEYSDFYDFSSSYPENHGAGDDDEAADQELSERIGALDIDDETLELVLPSGARLGHRAFKTYFKQSLPPDHMRASKSTATKISNEYRALGWHGTMAVEVRKKMVALRKIRTQRQRSDVRLQLKANKMQPHLRPQVIF